MILAIDTATRWLGLALHNGTAVLAESGWRCLNNHTIELTPAIQHILQQTETTMADLTGIAVTIGPGSYTGLRVGLAVAKGLALANQTPLMGVSTLDCLAAGVGPQPGKLIAVAEAGRTRVCTAVYEWQNNSGWQPTQTPTIDAWDELLTRLDGDGRLLFAGEISPEAVKKIRAAGKEFRVALPAASVRRAAVLAEIGWRRLRQGQVDDAASLAPLYLKEPDGR
ncbi:MAG TPA: tRNA (adenosine(37)-N6)-threonylcarbamoyltransferase complex dimerization subunit type 1 TsaB [Chloroflexota bacterium]|nr:tRNA (adenosine(37)-N6)-threonylcarbamoyltransferase complex dimerization subunit type 1 TsaB [Chloroflexota bacterium]HUM68494.1 tRNA (adenosine(37)-N6)-threonylcarbamoyltransferase complex dimerization subunit type 1 TsaB [Chloroflexota bacterium]